MKIIRTLTLFVAFLVPAIALAGDGGATADCCCPVCPCGQ